MIVTAAVKLGSERRVVGVKWSHGGGDVDHLTVVAKRSNRGNSGR